MAGTTEGRPAAAAAQAGAPRAVRRLLAAWQRAEAALAVAAFGFIAAVLIVDVAGRELAAPLAARLGFAPGALGVFGAQKMAVFALVIASFAGLGLAAASGAHLVPRVARGALPAAWDAALDRIADALSALALLAAAGYALEFVAASRASGMRAAMLQWPVWPIQLAMPLGFASAALRYACFAAWPALRPVPAEP